MGSFSDMTDDVATMSGSSAFLITRRMSIEAFNDPYSTRMLTFLHDTLSCDDLATLYALGELVRGALVNEVDDNRKLLHTNISIVFLWVLRVAHMLTFDVSA